MDDVTTNPENTTEVSKEPPVVTAPLADATTPPAQTPPVSASEETAASGESSAAAPPVAAAPSPAPAVAAAPAAVERGVGVLLVNLGTPDAPDAKAVRRYLHEFLTDPRVIENQGLF